MLFRTEISSSSSSTFPVVGRNEIHLVYYDRYPLRILKLYPVPREEPNCIFLFLKLAVFYLLTKTQTVFCNSCSFLQLAKTCLCLETEH